MLKGGPRELWVLVVGVLVDRRLHSCDSGPRLLFLPFSLPLERTNPSHRPSVFLRLPFPTIMGASARLELGPVRPRPFRGKYMAA